ncbi:hypothetical protein [Salsipaludibacter albus]|uniref:hypothetical protein n=1 Tax=Salsipaludibacter albus TaxID=2849650 RepID=UPI001EE466AB|nr:hypothetical protein [Salsipaludibacter albus]MBY5162879.1 hypothetical protein [Salsipaludibacter albus]
MAGFRVRPEVAGELGDNTDMDTTVHPPVVRRLHHVFSGWLGDDIVESFPCYLVTTDLATAITEAGLSGAWIDEAEISLDPQFTTLEPEQAAALPHRKWLRINGAADKDDLWQDEQAQLFVNARALAILKTCSLAHTEIVPK